MPDLRLVRLLLTALLLVAAVPLAPAATTHTVKAGETLSSIAAAHGVTVKELARANRLKDADLVRRGQKLLIPGKPAAFVEHTVARGESLAKIAKRYNVSLADIRAYNELPDPDHITRGQKLKIPANAAATRAAKAATSSEPPARSTSAAGASVVPSSVQAAINRASVKAGRWKNIVIHHSGTKEGSGKGMDRYHREERHMENGLAYHFVIGNGRGMRDGDVYVGRRWTAQLDGGHLAIPALNANSIGICLVGDFSRTGPSKRQLDALEALCRALMSRTRVRIENVTTHCLIHPRHTQCPGKRFPTEAFLQRLRRG